MDISFSKVRSSWSDELWALSSWRDRVGRIDDGVVRPLSVVPDSPGATGAACPYRAAATLQLTGGGNFNLLAGNKIFEAAQLLRPRVSQQDLATRQRDRIAVSRDMALIDPHQRAGICARHIVSIRSELVR